MKRGPGFWKFNDTLVYDVDYVNAIKSLIKDLRNEYAQIENHSLLWDLFKMKIREYTISYAKYKAKENRKLEKDLQDRYTFLFKQLHETDDFVEQFDEEFEKVKLQIEKVNEKKVNGIKIRSRAQFIEENECNTKYFLNLESRNYKLKHITKLENSDGHKITDASEILKMLQQFYEKLYSDTTDSNTLLDELFTTNLPQLTKDSVRELEQPLTEKEITRAVKILKTGRSPGSDGYTATFYKFFWIDIKDLVIQSIKYAFSNNLLSQDQRRAILRLLPKIGKDALFIKNWRPISLLNTDYKILAQTLAIRL